MRHKVTFGLWLMGVLALAGCGGSGEHAEAEADAAAPREKVRKAIAWINPRSGSELGGSAIFINEADGIALQIQVTDADPNGKHAVHIHEVGDCSADDASSAGGHWNPSGHAHGKWEEGEFHLGDIGNLTADAEGKATLTLKTDRWSLGTGEENDILGLAVIVHEKADDFTSQPTGAAGGRVGCGVITAQ